MKLKSIELLLPQHFAPLHELFRLLVQDQRFHTGQKVFRSEAFLSSRFVTEKKTETKRNRILSPVVGILKGGVGFVVAVVDYR